MKKDNLNKKDNIENIEEAEVKEIVREELFRRMVNNKLKKEKQITRDVN